MYITFADLCQFTGVLIGVVGACFTLCMLIIAINKKS